MSKAILSSSGKNGRSIASGGAISKLVVLFTQLTRLVSALPIFRHEQGIEPRASAVHVKAMTPQEFYANLFTSIFLVLAGGVFAGLTLGLMGQDEVYLKVIATSGDRYERKYARKVLSLIGRGKHWVLVTLLLSNVITNETLPIVLDRCLGGGWPAVVTSTASIVIFGEIIPQSICVRYGLQVGAMFAPFVLFLMYIMYPIAYPISMLLDNILGEDHGTVYKKSGLKTLVTLHKTMGVERLNQDEVTIISAVLDLKEKPVSHIMTPIDRVYTMSADSVLDERTVEEIFNAGFSRIPIHLPNEPLNFIGMLLVRVLISYDPEDALPVAAFPLATLPETGVETSCLNILNYFQEGRSHMIVVSETPGEATGTLGVLTLEDVIEELIGEEIVDESDVYVDINRNIKRAQPGPLSKKTLTSYLQSIYFNKSASSSKRNSLDSGVPNAEQTPLKLNSSGTVMEGAKSLKPKNPASNPLETNKSFVTIKRPDMEYVKNSIIPNRGGRNSASIHPTEEDAIKDAKKRLSTGELSNVDSMTSQRFLLPGEKDVDVTDIKTDKSNGKTEHVNDYSSSNKSDKNVTEYQESRSYRTGGIVESVIKVQGVHKTIIEHISDDEDNDIEIDENATHDTVDLDYDEDDHLLSKHKTSSSASSESKNTSKFNFVWDKFK